jgi:hypothetical protein
MGWISTGFFIAVLIALIFYIVDSLNRMANDIKAILNKVSKDEGDDLQLNVSK